MQCVFDNPSYLSTGCIFDDPSAIVVVAETVSRGGGGTGIRTRRKTPVDRKPPVEYDDIEEREELALQEQNMQIITQAMMLMMREML